MRSQKKSRMEQGIGREWGGALIQESWKNNDQELSIECRTSQIKTFPPHPKKKKKEFEKIMVGKNQVHGLNNKGWTILVWILIEKGGKIWGKSKVLQKAKRSGPLRGMYR